MQTIPNVATSDGYVDACTLGPDVLATQLVYVVANAGVIAQFRPISADGTVQDFGPEVLITPTANTVQRCAGARFRSAVPGVPARIVAQLLEPSDPQFGGGVPFASTLAATGGLTPGVASVQVEKDGVLIGQEAALNLIGTPWTIADNGAQGRIDITPTGMVPLADTLLAASAGSVTFGSVPQGFRHLRAVLFAKTDRPFTADQINFRLNGDSAANYDWEFLQASAAAVVCGETFAGTSFGVGACAATAAGLSGVTTLDIPGYSDATLAKAFVSESFYKTGLASGNLIRLSFGGEWRNTAAITSITFISANGANFVAPSRMTLYGW